MVDQNATATRRLPTIAEKYGCALPLHQPLKWLRAGIADTFNHPLPSLLYGFVTFLLSVVVIWALITFSFSYILLPAVAGFLLVGPMLAVGLYEKSRLLILGRQHIGFADMARVAPKSRGELLILGVILMLVLLFWLRTAILLYALFFGLQPFTGISETAEIMFLTKRGQILLLIGTIIGGLFAAFTFSVSAFSAPMLMNEKKDTITAMVISLIMAWTNKPVAAVWALLVMLGFLLSVATALLGLIVIFPILGHATWHAYADIRGELATAPTEKAS